MSQEALTRRQEKVHLNASNNAIKMSLGGKNKPLSAIFKKIMVHEDFTKWRDRRFARQAVDFTRFSLKKSAPETVANNRPNLAFLNIASSMFPLVA